MSGLLLLGVVGIWIAIVVFVTKWLARLLKPGAIRNIVVMVISMNSEKHQDSTGLQ